jgi:hypothetical protein
VYALCFLPMYSAIDLLTIALYGALSVSVVAWDLGLIAAMLLTLGFSAGQCLLRNENDG